MKKHIVLFLIVIIVKQLNAQEYKECYDTIINLEEVSVYAKRNLSVIASNGKKSGIHVQGKGKTSLISRVDVDREESYDIEGIEFFFNYKWQNIEGEGFYIKPLILSSKNQKPGWEYIKDNTLYYVTKEINEIIHIDLSNLGVRIDDVESFFIGIEFVGADKKSKIEDFNVTMVPIKEQLNVSFIKGGCFDCRFSPFDLDEKNGLSLKYNLFYK